MNIQTTNRAGMSTIKRFLLACLLPLTLLLPSCATTSHPVPQSAASLVGMEPGFPDENQRGLLEKATHDELIREGLIQLGKGNLQLARLHFLVAVKKNPQSAPGLAGLGAVSVLEGNDKDAQNFFGETLAIDKEYLPALTDLGQLHRRHGRTAEALECLNRAMALRPDHPAVMTEMAITLDAAGRENEAEQLYLRVRELKPEDAAVRNNLGFNFLLQGRYEEAVSEFDKALSLAPADRRIRNNLAAAYALAGKEEHAFNLLARTVGEAGAHNNLGYIYMTRGEWVKAEKSFRSALRLNPSFYAKAKSNLEHLERIKPAEQL